MTLREFERDWLSLNCWLRRCVLPTSVALVAVLLSFRMITENATVLNHNALVVGFCALYFILIRGGHLIMIRALHAELKAKYPESYEKRLARIARAEMRRRNIGFTLTQIKREFMDRHKR